MPFVECECRCGSFKVEVPQDVEDAFVDEEEEDHVDMGRATCPDCGLCSDLLEVALGDVPDDAEGATLPTGTWARE